MTKNEQSGHSAKQTDQRHALRAPLIVEQVPCADAHKSFFGYAKDISRGGMFIATVKPRDPGDRFLVELTLPMSPEPLVVRCQCEVVWKRHFERKGAHEPGMGLRFLDLPEATGRRIDDWVRAQLAKQQK